MKGGLIQRALLCVTPLLYFTSLFSCSSVHTAYITRGWLTAHVPSCNEGWLDTASAPLCHATVVLHFSLQLFLGAHGLHNPRLVNCSRPDCSSVHTAYITRGWLTAHVPSCNEGWLDTASAPPCHATVVLHFSLSGFTDDTSKKTHRDLLSCGSVALQTIIKRVRLDATSPSFERF
ncbi:hypothetical protein J6590_011214 [Homalodisca vitripennis]|nr:hypothetical protein J6590_011214 [Homalodisca vitripennis]